MKKVYNFNGCSLDFSHEIKDIYKFETTGKEGTNEYSKILKKVDHHIKKLEDLLTKAKR